MRAAVPLMLACAIVAAAALFPGRDPAPARVNVTPTTVTITLPTTPRTVPSVVCVDSHGVSYTINPDNPARAHLHCADRP